MLKYKEFFKFAFVLFWVTAVAAGLYTQYKFSFTEGKASYFESQFPRGSILTFNSDKFNLITFIHPKCACSKATLENLRLLNNQYGNKIQFHVVFYMPSSKKDDWMTSDYINEVKALKNTDIYFDEEEKEFARFDAQTSGQSFLFTPSRELIFKGGLTESRGHMGDSLAMRGIASILDTHNKALITAPTFGCENDIKKY